MTFTIFSPRMLWSSGIFIPLAPLGCKRRIKYFWPDINFNWDSHRVTLNTWMLIISMIIYLLGLLFFFFSLGGTALIINFFEVSPVIWRLVELILTPQGKKSPIRIIRYFISPLRIPAFWPLTQTRQPEIHFWYSRLSTSRADFHSCLLSLLRMENPLHRVATKTEDSYSTECCHNVLHGLSWIALKLVILTKSCLPADYTLLDHKVYFQSQIKAGCWT